MARGKYSPTVATAYRKNQAWFEMFSNGEQYDPEGYDSYGYDKNDIDRAGNHEFDYTHDGFDGRNRKFDDAWLEWVFDGVKPVRK